MTRDEFIKQCPPIVVGNKLWRECAECGQVVRINKPVIGSLHFCVGD